jgi:hypothetical protein
MDLLNSLSTMVGLSPFILILLILWSVVWKGLALWRAAHLGQKYWFSIILVVNTLGILEIIYLLVTNKKTNPTV